MKTTMTLSMNLNTSPFEVLKQDVDDVIMVINFYIALGGEHKQTAVPDVNSLPNTGDKPKRIKVNDKTATGGWF